CDQRHVYRVRYIELQRPWILLGCELGFAAGQILEANLGCRNCKVASKQAPKRRTTSGEVNSVFFEVKSAGAYDLIRRQDAGFGACFCRFIKTHCPEVNSSRRKHRL